MTTDAVAGQTPQDARGARWSPVPDWLLCRGDVPPAGRLLYGFLLGRADAAGRAWPSVETMAAAVAVTPRHVRTLLRALERRGLLRGSARPQDTTLYVFPSHPWQEDPGTGVPAEKAPPGTPVPQPPDPQFPNHLIPSSDDQTIDQTIDQKQNPPNPPEGGGAVSAVGGSDPAVALPADPPAPPRTRRRSKTTPTSDPAVSTADVRAVFDHWVTVLRKRNAKLDAKRERCIRWALSHYGLADCKRAIEGCTRSPFHMGKNDRGKPFNGPDLIFRDAQHVEDFLALADRPAVLAPAARNTAAPAATSADFAADRGADLLLSQLQP